MSAQTDPSILVVDDVLANIIALEAVLEPLGRRIVRAASGNEALQRVLDQDLAVVLLDVQMPDMDGYEVARWIRSRERSRHLPIIFVTAHNHDDQAVLKAYELGAVDFLYKPLNAEIVRAKTQVFVQLALAKEAEALRRENEQLALANRRKNEFLAMLGHELRNPLAPLRTSIDLLARTPDKPASPRLLKIFDRQLRHVTRLVDDLLDVSRISAGKIELRTAPVHLGDVIDESLAIAHPLIDARGHTLAVQTGGGDVIVDGDRTRLVQVTTNLLSNAARYTPEHGHIELSWGEDSEGAFVRVRDNGIGIPTDVLPRVFDMFVQERSGSDGNGGLGLGLALARELVRLHGGTLNAASAGRDRGAMFELRLPVSAVSAALVASYDAEPDPAPTIHVRPLRALVIDDDQDIRELTAELLSSYGHDVTTAHDGPSGLEMLLALRPDVALVDLGLPHLDGCALARAFRAQCPQVPTRLVAMTGYGQESDRTRARESGFDRHVVKPVSIGMLLAALGE